MTKTSIYRPLQRPDFRLIWVGGVISSLGTMVQTVGAGWLMTTIATSNDLVALVQSATTMPIMLFSIVAGALADSYERRRILMVAQLFMMLTAAILGVVAYTDQVTPLLLLVLSFLTGCGTALHTPSWQASVGDLVAREDIPAAVTLNSMGLNLTRSIGPALGGFIVAATGAASAFAFNAASFLPMIYALLRWKPEPRVRLLPREDFRRAVWSGFRYVAMSPNLLRVIARGFLFGLSAIAILALLPLVARDLVHGGASVYGLLLGAFGIGAIGGGLMNAGLRRRFSNEAIVRGAFLGIALSAALVSQTSSFWLIALFLLPAGASWVLALSLFTVAVQLSTPRWVLGRTLSIYQTASFGGMSAGGWLWGILAERFDLSAALLASAAMSLVGIAFGLRYTLPGLVASNLDPLNQFSEPSVQLDLQERSGPILINIEYVIAQEKVPAFLEAIAERRRSRIRDGARHWSLLRDLHNPELWKEAYHFPTWVEYIRHNLRRTQADAEITDRLIDLNGGQKPAVYRMIELDTIPAVDDMVIQPRIQMP